MHYVPKYDVYIDEDLVVYRYIDGRLQQVQFRSYRGTGYEQASIKNRTVSKHRIVAEAFIPNPSNKPEVDHINRVRTDNRVCNLRWVDRKEQARNKSSNDRAFSKTGTHFYEDEVAYRKAMSREYRKTHKNVLFADGKQRYVPTELGMKLLQLPVNNRNWGEIHD